MALMNRRLNPTIETVFMMPAEQYTYISSRLIKEVVRARRPGARPGAPTVEERLREKKAGCAKPEGIDEARGSHRDGLPRRRR